MITLAAVVTLGTRGCKLGGYCSDPGERQWQLQPGKGQWEGCFLKIEPAEFSDGLVILCERKKRITNSRCFGLNTEKLPSGKMHCEY